MTSLSKPQYSKSKTGSIRRLFKGIATKFFLLESAMIKRTQERRTGV